MILRNCRDETKTKSPRIATPWAEGICVVHFHTYRSPTSVNAVALLPSKFADTNHDSSDIIATFSGETSRSPLSSCSKIRLHDGYRVGRSRQRWGSKTDV